MMTRSDLDILFEKITRDGLTSGEQQEVADVLSKSSDPAVQERALHILGWSRSTAHAPLVASFLSRLDHIPLPAIALRALVRWFGDASAHLDILNRFLTEISEDPGRDLQLTALQVAGDAYRQTKDRDLLCGIMTFLDDRQATFREQAQESLVTALAPDRETLTPRERETVRRDGGAHDFVAQSPSDNSG